MINQLPWRKKLRTSAANNLDKINEVIDYINHSDISPVTLSDSASGRVVDVGMASSMKGLEVYGESAQNGVPTPTVPVPIQVMRGKNLINESASTHLYAGRGEATFREVSNVTSYIVEVSRNTDYTVSFKTANRLIINGSGNVYPAVGVAVVSLIADLGSNPRTTTFNTGENNYIVVHLATGGIVEEPQVEKGTTPTPYVPYGHVVLEVRSGETLVSCTPIPLPSKGWAGSLPDGTKDVLTVDSAGKWSWENTMQIDTIDGYTLKTKAISAAGNSAWLYISERAISKGYTEPNNSMLCNRLVASARSFPNISNGIAYPETFDNTVLAKIEGIDYTSEETVDNWLQSNPLAVLYELATPTTESGYIDVPAIPEGAAVTINATIAPEFNIEWWCYQDITDMIADLKEYTDWKVSQVGNASALSNSRMSVNQAVERIAEDDKIEEIKDTEVK